MSISIDCTAVSGVWVCDASTSVQISAGEIAKNLHVKCEYCGSRCEDSRGNCGACGAPKE